MKAFASLDHPRVLVVALSGIGNLLMASPLFRALKGANPRTEITVLIAPRGTAEVLERNADIALLLRGKPKPTFQEWLGTVRMVQRQRFDIGIVTYPGQLVTSASTLFFGKIPLRIGHRYTYQILHHTGLFLNKPYPVEHVHDVEQNLGLLKPLGIPIDLKNARYAFPIPQEDSAAAQAFLEEHHLTGKRLIGFHPGAHADMDYKRWPAERWTELGKRLANTYNAKILLFGGAEERALKEDIRQAIGAYGAFSIELPLRTTAALMSHCSFFVSNDSGLMHVAVSQNVPTFSLFGPTDERRTAPWGPRGHVIRAAGTKPTYDVQELSRIRERRTAHESLLALGTDIVFQTITSLLSP